MDALGTRDRLILAAEQLFAERGIDAVSLREVNLVAGQRNTSASHYHFGSKDALIEAILDLRQPELSRRRKELFDALVACGSLPTIRELVVVMVQPLLELAANTKGAANYVPFLAQLFLQPPASWQKLVARPDASVPRVALEMNRTLQLPLVLLRQRIAVMMQHVVNSLATHARVMLIPSNGGLPPLSAEAFGIALVDGITGYLTAPVSPELTALLPRE